MKLVHELLDSQISFVENKINLLVIENKNKFTELVEELKNQVEGGEGKFVLSNNGKEIEIKQSIDLIFSPFSVQLSSSNINNSIYKKLETEINNELYKEKVELFSLVENFVVKAIDEYPVHLSINEEINLNALLKNMKVQVEQTDLDISARVLDHLRIASEILNYKCVVLVNFRQYFSDDDINTLYKEIMYEKYNILIIENGVDTRKFPQENTVLIDDDLCEIIY